MTEAQRAISRHPTRGHTMTSTEELKRLLAEHNANMARIQAARDEGYRLPTEDEWKMRDTQDRLRSAAVNALPALISEVEELREALAELADASERMLNQGDDGGYTEQTANSVAIRIDRARALTKGDQDAC